MHLVGVDEGSSNHIALQIGVGGRHPVEKRGCIVMPFQNLNVTNVTRLPLPTYAGKSAGSGAEQRCWRSRWRHLEQK